MQYSIVQILNQFFTKMREKRGVWEHVLENNRACIKSSVGFRQFRCADLWASYCRIPLWIYTQFRWNALKSRQITGFLTCHSFPDGWKWHVLQEIIMIMENLCSHNRFYSMIVVISLYIDCRVVVFHNNTLYLGVIIIGDMVCWPGSPFSQKSSVKIIHKTNECIDLWWLTTCRINQLPMF